MVDEDYMQQEENSWWVNHIPKFHRLGKRYAVPLSPCFLSARSSRLGLHHAQLSTRKAHARNSSPATPHPNLHSTIELAGIFAPQVWIMVDEDYMQQEENSWWVNHIPKFHRLARDDVVGEGHGLGAGLLAEPRVLLEVAVGEAVGCMLKQIIVHVSNTDVVSCPAK
ncbi:hypothetical protein C4D60_Mb01t01120 [Musa balbisiana]|uniref:Uncharacterized protein n=1 Tax=Musa balbisiana TaxID=52838 RepID=A0A4S8JJS1_MUSBA|nr:hypothetical protein C4D60_Mb01t01120 [Musa balbisiana]